MPVDPRFFAPFNLGELMRNAEAIRGSQSDRAYREHTMQQQIANAEREKAERAALGSFITGGAPAGASPHEAGHPGATLGDMIPAPQAAMAAAIRAGADPAQVLQAHRALRGETPTPTNIEREVAYYRSIGRPDLAETRLRNHAEGAPVLFDINGDGAPDLVPRSHFNQPPQAAPAGEIPDGTVIENDAGVRLVRRGGRWVPAGGAGSQAQTPFNPSAIPANFTSGRRTPEGNRLVGGVPNSAHLTGDAADFAPRPGQTMRQLEADLRRRFPNARVINEGDHVHIQQRGLNAPYHGRRGTTGLRGS